MDATERECVVTTGRCAGPEMTVRALSTGEKLAQMAFMPTLLLGIMAGVYIGFGANVFTIARTDSHLGFGPQQLLSGLGFCLGLILVVIGGAELFTGNTAIVMAWLSGRVTTRQLLLNWGIVYVGNLAGSLLLVWLAFAGAQYLQGDQAVGQTAVKIAAAKCSMPFGVVLARGILCNALVCLAVWLCYSACSTTDKILAIVFPVTAFVAGGFEHCVANMYLVPIGIAIKNSAAVGLDGIAGLENLTSVGFVVRNLIPSTLGNIIGGAVMVCGTYWAAYILPTLTDRRPLPRRRPRATEVHTGAPGHESQQRQHDPRGDDAE